MDMGGVVGSGTFGVVFKAMDGGTPVALKRIKMERETQGFPVTAIREIKLCKALRHVNIVNMREVVVYNAENDKESVGASANFTNGDVFMVFDYGEYDLSGILQSRDVVLTKAHIKSYTRQLLEGIHFMHKNMILHRDLKSANILITKDNVLKVADLGLAHVYQKDNARMTNPVCSLWYRCPELLCGVKQYGPEVDMWSVGCIFAEMYSRRPILAVNDKEGSEVRQMELLYQEFGTPTGDLLKKYEGYPDWEKFKFSTKSANRIRGRFEDKPLWDDFALSLLESMLHFDPTKRLSASDALTHDYFYCSGEEVVPAEQLERFHSVALPRGMDVQAKQKEDYESAVEAARVAEEKKKAEEEALAAAIKAEKKQQQRQRQHAQKRHAGLGGGGKYKVLKPGAGGGPGPGPGGPLPLTHATSGDLRTQSPASVRGLTHSQSGLSMVSHGSLTSGGSSDPALGSVSGVGDSGHNSHAKGPTVPTINVPSGARGGAVPEGVKSINVTSLSSNNNDHGNGSSGW